MGLKAGWLPRTSYVPRQGSSHPLANHGAGHRLGRSPLTTASVLALQRQGGNAAVNSLLCAQRAATGARPLLRIGSRGPAVVELQQALKIAADGAFGPRTHKAVVTFQRGHGLSPDGVVGQKTWGTLDGAPPAATPVSPVHAAVLVRLQAIREKLRELTASKGGTGKETDVAAAQPQGRDDLLDGIGEGLDAIGETVGGVVGAIGDTVGGVVDTVGGAVDTIGETIGDAVDTVGETIGGVVDTVGETISGVVDTVGETIGGAVDSVETAVGAIASEVAKEIDSIAGDLREQFKDVLGPLAGVLGGLGMGMGDGKSVLEKLEEIWKALTGGSGDKEGGDLPDIPEAGPPRPSCAAADDPRGPAGQSNLRVNLGLNTHTVQAEVSGSSTRNDIVRDPNIGFRASFHQDLPLSEVLGAGKEKPMLSITMIHWSREGDSVSVLGSMQLRCSWNIKSQGLKDISGPDDAKITSITWSKVVSDLTPNENGFPPRTEYWVPDITKEHELYHAGDDFITARNDVESGACLGPIKNVYVTDPEKQLPGLLTKVRDHVAIHLNEHYAIDGEGRAYRGTAHLYRGLVEQIKARAAKEGWKK